MRRGQVSFFIVVGIVLLIAAGLLMYGLTKIDRTGGRDFSNVESFFTSCLGNSVANEIAYRGLTGFSEQNVNIYRTDVALYRRGHDNLLLSIEDIERDVARGSERRFVECVSDFDAIFPGYRLKAGLPEINVAIGNGITAEMSYDARVSIDGNSIRFREFLHESDLRVGGMLEMIDGAINTMIEHDGMINQTLIQNSGFYAEIYKYEHGVLFFITDKSSLIEGRDLEIVFAAE